MSVKNWWLVLSVSLVCGSLTLGSTYSLDYSGAGNPNGVWTYGYLPDNGTSARVLYESFTTVVDGKIGLWYTGDSDFRGNCNKGFAALDGLDYGGCGMSWEAGMTCIMAPVIVSHWASAGFTAPQSGLWDVTVNFENRVMNGEGTKVFVRVNGTDVLLDQIDGFSGSSLGAPAVASVNTDGPTSTYHAVLNLAQNDTVLFGSYAWTGMGFMSDGGYHQVAVEATLFQAPEPASMGLLLLGGLFLRRKS